MNSKEVTKKVPFADLSYYIKSTLSNELLLFFDDDTDIRLIFDEREEMLTFMKMRFANLAKKKNLNVFGVPQTSLKNFKASKKGDNGYAFDVRPGN